MIQMSNKPRSRVAGATTALTLFGTLAMTSGCEMFMQKPHCEELANCGGDLPVGNWILGPGNPSCSEDLYVPPTDTRLVGADVTAARIPPPEPALFDWCILLVANGGKSIQAKPPRFFY
ncbi:MAG TPA: hypothetical protein VGF45_22170, partial [Polyangia bacterium]